MEFFNRHHIPDFGNRAWRRSGVWGVINLLEGYGNDNPGANAHVS